MINLPDPPQDYDPQDQRELRRQVSLLVDALTLKINEDPAILDIMATFTNLGVASVSVVANEFTKSVKCAVSTVAFPSVATVQAATATDGARADLTFAGPYAMGATLYVSALAYSSAAGAGTASDKFDVSFVVSDIQSTLLVTVTQTSSTGFSDPGAGVNPQVVLDLVVTDPAALLTGNALVTLTTNGIVSLEYWDGAAWIAAVTGNRTIGVTYQYRVTLAKALGGGSYVKFAATKTGGYKGEFVWWGSSAWMDAHADLIITIGDNENSSTLTAKASLVVNTVENADSMKWLASTSSQPAKATVIASGTSVSTGPPFYVTDLGVHLSFSDTVYVTVVLYDYLGVVIDHSYEAKATRANLAKSKTLQWAATGAFHAYTVAQQGDIIATYPRTVDRSLDELFVNFVGPGAGLCYGATPVALMAMDFAVADGGTATGASADFMSQTGANSTTTCVVDVYAVSVGTNVGASASIGTMTATATGSYQTVSASFSQSTTGKRFVVKCAMTGNPLCETDSYYAKFRSFTFTYLPGSLQATV